MSILEDGDKSLLIQYLSAHYKDFQKYFGALLQTGKSDYKYKIFSKHVEDSTKALVDVFIQYVENPDEVLANMNQWKREQEEQAEKAATQNEKTSPLHTEIPINSPENHIQNEHGDISTPEGTPVLAPVNGQVLEKAQEALNNPDEIKDISQIDESDIE